MYIYTFDYFLLSKGAHCHADLWCTRCHSLSPLLCLHVVPDQKGGRVAMRDAPGTGEAHHTTPLCAMCTKSNDHTCIFAHQVHCSCVSNSRLCEIPTRKILPIVYKERKRL